MFNAALGEVTMRYLKGSLVYLEGQLETRKWRGNDGADHYTTEVVLRPYRGEITMLDPAPRAPRPERSTRAPARKARTPAAPRHPVRAGEAMIIGIFSRFEDTGRYAGGITTIGFDRPVMFEPVTSDRTQLSAVHHALPRTE